MNNTIKRINATWDDFVKFLQENPTAGKIIVGLAFFLAGMMCFHFATT